MNKYIPLHQYQYKYVKMLEYKKKLKKMQSLKEYKSSVDKSMKYSNETYSNKKTQGNLKINLIKKIGQTEFKPKGQKNIYIHNYADNKYKNQSLLVKSNNDFKIPNDTSIKKNSKIINKDISKIKIKNIVNNNI